LTVFLVTGAHAYTITGFLENWAPELADRFTVIPYEDLPRHRALVAGTVIFADLERLRGERLNIARAAADQLARSPLRPLLLNDPRRALRRYELLRRLSEQGVNDFNVYRLNELPRAIRYPVFLRNASDHSGPQSRLLHTRDELERTVCSAAMWGFDLRDLLVVEYLDTAAPDGLYRKYGAFVFGGRIVPKHVFHGREPFLKSTERADDATRAEVKEFLHRNPHADVLGEVAQAVGIDYGRFDYGVRDGRPQIWELNTNPVIESEAGQSRSRDPELQRWTAARVSAALAELDDRGRAQGLVALDVRRPRRPPPRENPQYYPGQPLKRRMMFAGEPIARSLHRQLFPLFARRARGEVA
jgi:hypothetical protein